MDKPTIFVNPKSGSIKISGEVDVVDVDGKVSKALLIQSCVVVGSLKISRGATHRMGSM